MRETMLTFLGSQIFQAPFLIAYVVAIVLAFTRYPSQGRLALFAGLGFSSLTIGWLINAAYMYWQLSTLAGGRNVQELARVAFLAGSASTLAELIGLVLVMLALFGMKSSSVGDANKAMQPTCEDARG